MKNHSISLPVSVGVVTVVLLLGSSLLLAAGGAEWYGAFLCVVVVGGFLGMLVPLGMYRYSQKTRSLSEGWLIGSFVFATTSAVLAYLQLAMVQPPTKADGALQQAAQMVLAGFFPSVIFWMAIGGIQFLEKRANAIAVEPEQPSFHALASSPSASPYVSVCFFATGRLTVDLAAPVIGVPVQVRIGSTVIDISNETAT